MYAKTHPGKKSPFCHRTTRVVSDHQMTCYMLSKNTIEKNTNLLIEVETINQHTLDNMRYGLNQQNIYYKLYHNGEATVNENWRLKISIYQK